MREVPLIVWATLFLTSFNYLIHGWHGNFLLFLIWIIPAVLFWTLTNNPYGDPKPVVLAALVTYLASMIVDLNILSHLALALSIAAFIPLSIPSLIWIFGALFWIPSTGWILNKADLNYDLFKLGAILVSMTPLIYKEWRDR